eukprot:1793784-Pyramimonas_sp.AAC.1
MRAYWRTGSKAPARRRGREVLARQRGRNWWLPHRGRLVRAGPSQFPAFRISEVPSRRSACPRPNNNG